MGSCCSAESNQTWKGAEYAREGLELWCEGDVVSLHLLQLAFGDRKRVASGQVMYEGLEYCGESYSLDLTGGVFPLRGRASNTKLISCQTVKKFRRDVDGEDSVNEVVSPDTSVSIFSWQVKTYGQGKPSTYLGVFDINRWYHAQMPDSLRPEELHYDCPYFALWSLDTVVSMTSPKLPLDILVHERSLSRGVPPSYPPPEQFFHARNYNFDGTCLLNSGVVHVTCTGFQKETLNFLKKSGPSIREAIQDSYNRCLVAGLLSPRLVDVQPSSLSQGLEYCGERYSLDLTGGVFPLRGRASNTKLISCQTVEKFRRDVDGEDSVNEVVSPDTSVSIFSWQVKTYGQGKPSTYLGVFDINRWYHAQMPDSLRLEELHYDCPYFALWSLDTVVSMTSPKLPLDILVHERSLSRGVPPSYPPPEQFFHARNYNFDGTCLLNSGVVHVTCTGFQKETLNFLKKSGPSIREAIQDSYNRCLVAGLLSPRLVDVQPSSLSQEEQLEAVLSAAVQTGSVGLLTGCIKHWISEEQPSSAGNLRFVLEWTWNKVLSTKDEFDQICVPLFDGSCSFIDPQTLRSLQRCQLLLSNLSTVFNCFLTEAQELTEKGFADVTNKRAITGLISLYARVVIWFCRSGLLPEGLDDAMHLSRPFYNYPLIQSYYTGHREKLERLSRGKWDSDCLMVDGMVSQLGDQVEKLWRRDEGGTGKYPPASLHALLDLYLLESIEENYKHAITIYLLLDIKRSFPNKTETSMDSFPTAFGIPWGLVKLVEGCWLLDHNDYENSLALLFHPATIKTASWQHKRIIQSLMCQGEHRQALRYIQLMRPPVSSSGEVQLFLTVLLSNRCMVEAWGLLHQHATKVTLEDLLKHMYETCREMGLMEDLLKLPFTDTEQECLEKFLRTSASVQNHEFLLVHHLQRANYIAALELNQSMNVNLMNDGDPRLTDRAVARNFLLAQYGKMLPRIERQLAVERAKLYHLPSSASREVSRPKPVRKQAKAGNVRQRPNFMATILSRIKEVWAGMKENTGFSKGDRR
ncbi:protein ELYS-like [Alca torda]